MQASIGTPDQSTSTNAGANLSAWRKMVLINALEEQEDAYYLRCEEKSAANVRPIPPA